MKQSVVDVIVIVCMIWFSYSIAKLIMRLYELSQ